MRTVTYHLTGRVIAIDGDWLTLEKAAWIADSSRYADAVNEPDNLSEVEPIASECISQSQQETVNERERGHTQRFIERS